MATRTSSPARKATRTSTAPATKPTARKRSAPAKTVKSISTAPATTPAPVAADIAPLTAKQSQSGQPIRTANIDRTAKEAKPEKAVKATKAAKPADKTKKPKLVRDSFTIPKPEYEAIAGLKLRAAKLGQTPKKSELLRAGLKALAAMNDTDLVTCLAAVPAIKTGRPAA